MENNLEGYTQKELDFINRKIQSASKMNERIDKQNKKTFSTMELLVIKNAWNKSKSPQNLFFKAALLCKINNNTSKDSNGKENNSNKKTIIQKVERLNEYECFRLICISQNII